MKSTEFPLFSILRIDAATADGIDVMDAEKPGDIGVSITALEDTLYPA